MDPDTASRDEFTRRRFLRVAGIGTAGVAIFGVAACTSNSAPESTTATTTLARTSTTATAVTTTGEAVTESVSSSRVNLDFVSAYVVERGDGLVVIDTGVEGSAPAFEAVVREYGKSLSDVGYVIATHRHGDHVGSREAVIAAAADADLFAGGPDIPAIASGRIITPLKYEAAFFGHGDPVLSGASAEVRELAASL